MAATQLNVSNQLPAMILSANQVVLYAPALMRPDVAEAVRRAITERGTQVFLLTTRPPLFSDNSLTFRLMLMKVPTYLTSGSGLPFALLDGQAISGPGVAGPGTATLASRETAARLTRWTQDVTQAKPLNPVEMVKVWVEQKHGVRLK
ncbi:hypothetical protein [Deinococcus multiflagellatus]|uniref:Uncharacterized protein n=1 Tax=Deinococcus multiflagellatus TaxID=1656887 RepID=A0ABW1ZSF8_9DEIO